MVRYVISRLLQALLILFIVSILAFALLRLVPGDPARIILGAQRATPHAVANLNHELGLDRPVVEQYGEFISGAVSLDFGQSLRYRQPVSDLIGPRLVPSLLLVAYSCLIVMVMVVPLGIISAVRRNRPADHLVRLSGAITNAMPPFLTGLILILIFSVGLGIFPVEGYGEGFWGHIRSLTLPSLTLALVLYAFLLRTLRSGLIETLSQDFIEAARARGLADRRVLFKHALSNSILPTVTVLGVFLGLLLSWTFIVEVVFSIPGIGSLLVSSVAGRDYPVIQALILLIAVVVVFSNLAADLIYRLVDPRIRL